MTSGTKPPAACLIGWPAAHSRSPLIHHSWLRKLGIEGGYTIESVPPEDVAEFITHLSHHGFVGANVTIPHKERALLLSVPDERKQALGITDNLVRISIGVEHADDLIADFDNALKAV